MRAACNQTKQSLSIKVNQTSGASSISAHMCMQVSHKKSRVLNVGQTMIGNNLLNNDYTTLSQKHHYQNSSYKCINSLFHISIHTKQLSMY